MKWLMTLCLILVTTTSVANELPRTLARIKPSIVAIGVITPLPNPTASILGTGFVIDDGSLIATNAHVVQHKRLNNLNARLTVFVGHGKKVARRLASIVAINTLHDLAILRISGKPLPALTLSQQRVFEGENVAFTGFPVANALGLYPVTHQGIISSIAPAAVPVKSTSTLSAKQLRALRNPHDVYLINAVAYPGNSGSPVYDIKTGAVIAMINKVLISSTKESALTNPTAMTYAIHIKHLRAMLGQAKS